MKKSRYSDSQIISILNQAEAGTPVPEFCREHGMSSASFYSYSQRTPCVGICYHPKLYGFARTMDIEDYFLPSTSSQKQQDGTYGYYFSSSLFRKGMLVDTSLSAMNNFPFQMMVKYNRRLLAALTIIQP